MYYVYIHNNIYIYVTYYKFTITVTMMPWSPDKKQALQIAGSIFHESAGSSNKLRWLRMWWYCHNSATTKVLHHLSWHWNRDETENLWHDMLEYARISIHQPLLPETATMPADPFLRSCCEVWRHCSLEDFQPTSKGILTSCNWRFGDELVILQS